ncbi:molybdenum ABC transporter ATP-binding protein [Insolitispirillum peregrinum]|uniref:Molybdate transport system ATP-binding protein n=1 Tax=Insolitispirillum peregrinum TaxID=80876 RepID=A0A1N7L548_9PROT|nr:molybdenum ABC transporter ATP-binding protein [Insolitispirillum peregrinum]SIS68982.1 molybdate transport system ATP-binding protein [Insolitispirillum peregrinum]
MLTVDVTRTQGSFQIECAFSSAAAGITALFGPSGSGKTSVINMVAGLTVPDGGKIMIHGRPVVDISAGVVLPMERRRIGYVFQDGRLFPHLTVMGNLRYGMGLTPAAERSIPLDAVIELLGIRHLLDRRPAKLSGGEKQRVAIGRALLTSPHLLLMDEPLAALDSNRKDEVLPFIARLPREFDIPILYVTHSMDEILRLADLLVLMEQGRSAAVGTVEDLLNRPDLRHLTGRHEPGAVLQGTVVAHEERYTLSRLMTRAGPLLVPRLDLAEGTAVRVRVLARDVSLAAERPIGLSVQNVYRGTISSLVDAEGPYVDVHLDCQGAPMMSRVTRRAVAELGIEQGRTVYAMVKGVSIARGAVGERP